MKISTTVKRKINYRIRNFLRTNKNIRLRPYYDLQLNYRAGFNKTDIKKNLERLILSRYNNSYSQYVFSHTKVKFTNQHTLFSLLANYKKVLNNFNTKESKKENKECHCKEEEIKKCSGNHYYGKHICLKANKLPEFLGDLKEILTMSSKNPVTMDTKQYLGVQFRNILEFMKNNNLRVYFGNKDND